MTPGEKTVILVRAQTLSDTLRCYIAGAATPAEFVVFDAQRLASSCDRALGTRDRLADRLRMSTTEGGTR